MKPSETYTIFVTCPLGLQYVLERELETLGGLSLKPIPAGVAGEVDKVALYRILLWSRIANRVIVQLANSKVVSAEDIYSVASSIDWQSHFLVEHSFAVDFLGTNQDITNSTFGALKVKDAIVDQFRQETGVRPSVNKVTPDIRITARLSKGFVSIGIDLSGESLHKRGYRSATGKAPLKENVAAGLLALCGWPDKFQERACFVDPMCGSGTLLIEAAMILARKAPGLDRQYWGFDAWAAHDKTLWATLKSVANDEFQRAASEVKGRIVGFDQDGQVIHRAWQNIEQAGCQDLIHVEKRSLAEFELFEKIQPGLLLTNPPYGMRLGEAKALQPLYRLLGQQFEHHLLGWQAGVFTGNPELGRKIGWRSHKQYQLYNGAIESQLLLFQLEKRSRFKEEWQAPDQRLQDPKYWKISHPERADMFKNRLRKNQKRLSKWASREHITCYRLYDADMPEFALAIDTYRDDSGGVWLHVQEYKAPRSVDEKASLERLREALAVLPEALSVVPEHIVLKRREIQKGASQYDKNASLGDFLNVRENDAILRVNLTDYLDTGLFLDHRPMRRWVKDNVRNKRFLNLFCYTGAVTVSAAMGGAAETVSVDMSRTYLNWAMDNMRANNIDLSRHKFIQRDCLEWLGSDISSREDEEAFDMIFLDPPSFSNSKKMQGVLDIQRDHNMLIESAMKRLKPKGQLLFSCNLRKFKLDLQLTEQYCVSDMTTFSLDKDFERRSQIHQCWMIEFSTSV